MAATKEDLKDDVQTTGITTEVGDPPAKTPPKPADAPAAKVTATPAGGEEKPAKERVRLTGTDAEDLPDDETLVELSSKELKRRLGKEPAKELKKRFGTADFDEIKTKLDRLDSLEKAEEERAREAMTESDRLKADLQKERTRANEGERRLRTVMLNHAADKYENHVTSIAKQYIDPDFVDDALMRKFADFLYNDHLDAMKANKVSDSVVKAWMKEQVTKKPKIGKDFAPAEKVEKKVEKKLIDNGAKTNGRPTPSKDAKGTAGSFSPSAENAMSPAEARAAARKEGYTY